MKIISQNNALNLSLPPALYHAVHIADAIGKDGEEFSIFVGLEKKYAEQLKAFSLDLEDKELQENTGDRERFGTNSYEEWYEKNRTPFTLIHKQTDALTALVWLGPRLPGDKEAIPGNSWHTMGWRSYKPFRGKGLMKVFTEFAMSTYLKSFPNTKLWIATSASNTSSIRLAEELGFEIKENTSNDVSLVMIKE